MKFVFYILPSNEKKSHTKVWLFLISFNIFQKTVDILRCKCYYIRAIESHICAGSSAG